jgi:Domain of unknown function (DUF4177)
MLFQIGDSSQPQFPPSQPPHTQPSQTPHVQQMVYVYESLVWEYKLLTKPMTGEEVPSEKELNELGAAGWELVGVTTVRDAVRFYFKRPRK